MKQRERGHFDLEFIKAMDSRHRNPCIDLLDRSRSEVRQDLFALAQADFRKGGFFVEFNAGDGATGSSTWLLEKDFQWAGILAEPAPRWHDALRRNRGCAIDTRCVWRESGETVEITAPPVEAPPDDAPRASGGNGTGNGTGNRTAPRRSRDPVHEVETVSLNDLLITHGAPEVIDLVSIDTEGPTRDILSRFDPGRWAVRVFTITHNYTPERADIHGFLTAQGYRRVLEDVSRFNDWYVKDA